MVHIGQVIPEVQYQLPPVSAPGTTYPEPRTAKALEAHRAALYGCPTRQLCPECGGTGFTRYDAPVGSAQYGRIEPCRACSEEGQRAWLRDNCGLEGVHLDTSLVDWQPGAWSDPAYTRMRREAKGVIERALGQQTGLFTFWGDFGAGKTFALKIVVNETRANMIESFYAPFAVILDHLRSLMRQGEASSRFWQRLLDVPVLAVDEVTRFNETPWARERLWMLADLRYERRQSHLTCFATNDDPNASLPVTEPVGYLYSRMRQGTLVELRGDMRGTGA